MFARVVKMSIKFKLEVRNKQNRSYTYYPVTKTQVARKSVLRDMKSGYLRVQYTRAFYNDGDFNKKSHLVRALNQWTEKELLDYVKE